MAGETSFDCAGAEEVIRIESRLLALGALTAAPACGVRKLSSSRKIVLGVAILIVLALLSPATATPRQEPGIDALKSRISSASVGEKPHLCVQVAQMRLNEADKLFAAGDTDKAQAALTDVVAYSELARDYSIQSHKYQKQSEIAVRGMTRKLTDILHTLGQADQSAVKDAVNRLNRVRDDLLASMFKRGGK